jgi:uncharacterized membrane protein YfcA
VHAVILGAVGLWCFLVALVGGVAGLVLGNIRLPVFVFAATGPAAAGGANIAVSGLAAAAAATTHVRAGRVHWRLVAWMLPPSVAGALGGGYAAGFVPANALRIVIAAVLVAFGIDLLRPRGESPRRRATRNVPAAVIAGAAIGLLGGLIGLILGSLRLPALVRWVGEEPARAIGTNLVVGIAVGAAGLVGHLPAGIDWTLLWVGASGSVPGALLGARLTGRLSERALLRTVAVILLVAGAVLVVQASAQD